MKGHRVLGAAVTAFVALCVIPPAHAQSPQNKALAEQLFQDGRKAMDLRRYDEACPKFAASQKADPAIGTLLNLADCYEKNNQLASAWTTFLEAASFAARVGRNDRKQTAQERADKLEPRLVKLTILARASGIDVKFDGAPAVLGTAFPVDPGKHTIEANAKGKKPYTTSVDITDKSKNPSVDIPPLENDNGGPKDPVVNKDPKDGEVVPQPETVKKGGWSTQKTLGVVAAGVGVVALGAGVYYGLLTASRWNEAQTNCNNDQPRQCNEDGIALHSQAQSAGTIATIAFVAGGIFVAGGAVLFFTAPSAASPPPPKNGLTTPSNVRVGVGPGSLLLRGTF